MYCVVLHNEVRIERQESDNTSGVYFFPDPTAFPSEGLRRAYGGPAEGLDLKFVARGLQQGSVCNHANEVPFPREGHEVATM